MKSRFLPAFLIVFLDMHRSLVSAIIAATLFLACRKDAQVLKVDNLSGGKIYAFGHGGMGIKSLYPIDSYASLSEALLSGADGTEMDVQLSADSVLFLYHASDLAESSKCSGKIRHSSSSEINCEYTSIFHKGLSICKLEDFLSGAGKDTSKILTFECKSYDLEAKDYGTYVRALSAIVEKHHLQNRLLLESIIPDFLLMVNQEMPPVRTFLYAEDVSWAIRTADSLNFYGVTFDLNRVNKPIVKEAHARNLRVTLFNQKNRADNKRTLELSPDFIQTDALKDLVELLN